MEKEQKQCLRSLEKEMQSSRGSYFKHRYATVTAFIFRLNLCSFHVLVFVHTPIMSKRESNSLCCIKLQTNPPALNLCFPKVTLRRSQRNSWSPSAGLQIHSQGHPQHVLETLSRSSSACLGDTLKVILSRSWRHFQGHPQQVLETLSRSPSAGLRDTLKVTLSRSQRHSQGHPQRVSETLSRSPSAGLRDTLKVTLSRSQRHSRSPSAGLGDISRSPSAGLRDTLKVTLSRSQRHSRSPSAGLRDTHGHPQQVYRDTLKDVLSSSTETLSTSPSTGLGDTLKVTLSRSRRHSRSPSAVPQRLSQGHPQQVSETLKITLSRSRRHSRSPSAGLQTLVLWLVYSSKVAFWKRALLCKAHDCCVQRTFLQYEF
ncbi:uncharacterized protein LOC144763714 isoform X2 [Lissotriton helveticus]